RQQGRQRPTPDVGEAVAVDGAERLGDEQQEDDPATPEPDLCQPPPGRLQGDGGGRLGGRGLGRVGGCGHRCPPVGWYGAASFPRTPDRSRWALPLSGPSYTGSTAPPGFFSKV